MNMDFNNRRTIDEQNNFCNQLCLRYRMSCTLYINLTVDGIRFAPAEVHCGLGYSSMTVCMLFGRSQIEVQLSLGSSDEVWLTRAAFHQLDAV
jgi:hypothetical protein